MHLVEEDLAAHPEQVAHGHRHPFFRQDGVDLGLEAGAQMDELAPVADEFAQFAQRWWGDPGLGQTSHAQQVDQVGGIALIVFHPPMPPVVAQRMGQVHRGPALLDHISRPVPAIGGFEDHFGVLPGLGQLGRQGHRVVVDADRVEGLAGLVAPHDHAAPPVQVDADILLSGVPRESPSVVSGLVWQPQVCSAHLVPIDGRTPAGSSTSVGPEWRLSSRSCDRSSCSACGPVRQTGARHTGAALRSFITSRPQFQCPKGATKSARHETVQMRRL